MSKKITDLAKDLHITTQAIQGRISRIKGFRNKHTFKRDNRLIIDDQGVKILKNQDASPGRKSHQDEKLRKSVEDSYRHTKDLEKSVAYLKRLIGQYHDSNDTLEKSNTKLEKLLDQQQQLQLETSQMNRKLRHQVKQLRLNGSSTVKIDDGSSHKKGFFAKLIGKL